MSGERWSWVDYVKDAGKDQYYDSYREWKAKRLLMACLNTGALRCDTHRQLYEEVCRFCGVDLAIDRAYAQSTKPGS